MGKGEEEIEEITKIENDRLIVTLKYPNGAKGEFGWQVFNPESITALVNEVGFKSVDLYSELDSKLSPNKDSNRMQIFLKKIGCL